MIDKTVIKGLNLNSTSEELARRLVVYHFETMFSHITGIIENTDTEPVHKFRVASRRLRSVLETFGSIFPYREINNLVSEIEKIVPLTGKARDLDVSCIFIREYLTTVPREDRKGIRLYLREIQEIRRNLHPLLVEELKSFRQSGYLGGFHSTKGQIDLSLQHEPNDIENKGSQIGDRININAATPIFVAAARVIPCYLEELLSFDQKIYRTDNRKILHKMRIVTKKLRYNMEAFEPFFPENFPRFLTKIKRIQNYLGDIHDKDVQIQTLRKRIHTFLKQDLKKFRKIEQMIANQTTRNEVIYAFYREKIRNDLRGIIRLLHDQIHSRETRYRSFIRYWKTLWVEVIPDDILKSVDPNRVKTDE